VKYSVERRHFILTGWSRPKKIFYNS